MEMEKAFEGLFEIRFRDLKNWLLRETQELFKAREGSPGLPIELPPPRNLPNLQAHRMWLAVDRDSLKVLPPDSDWPCYHFVMAGDFIVVGKKEGKNTSEKVSAGPIVVVEILKVGKKRLRRVRVRGWFEISFPDLKSCMDRLYHGIERDFGPPIVEAQEGLKLLKEDIDIPVGRPPDDIYNEIARKIKEEGEDKKEVWLNAFAYYCEKTHIETVTRSTRNSFRARMKGRGLTPPPELQLTYRKNPQ